MIEEDPPRGKDWSGIKKGSNGKNVKEEENPREGRRRQTGASKAEMGRQL